MSLLPFSQVWRVHVVFRDFVEASMAKAPQAPSVAYLAGVVLLCAPSFVAYLLSALYDVTGDSSFIAPGLFLTAIAPFPLIGAAVVGLIGLYKSTARWVQVSIVLVFVTALAMSIYLIRSI